MDKKTQDLLDLVNHEIGHSVTPAQVAINDIRRVLDRAVLDHGSRDIVERALTRASDALDRARNLPALLERAIGAA